MERNKNRIFYFLLSLFLAFVIYSVYVWRKSMPLTENLNTSKSFTVSELITKVDKKNILTLKPFIEKAIEVNGVLKKVTYQNNRYSLLLEGTNTNVLVLCEMEKQQDVASLVIGEKIIVKGVFKGVLKDAILLNCILIGKETHE